MAVSHDTLTCHICGKTTETVRSWTKCGWFGGLICGSHCFEDGGCPHLENRTSLVRCTYAEKHRQHPKK